MSNFFSKYDIDTNAAEETGVPVNFGEGVIINVRRGSCEKAVKVLRREYQPYKAWREGSIPVEAQRKISAAVAAEGVVTGWTGMPDPDKEGALLPYSIDNAKALFSRFPDLVNDIMKAADADDMFTKEALEAVRKN